jgi:hypothetical protein
MAQSDLPQRQPGASGAGNPEPVPNPPPQIIFVPAKKS